MICRVLIGYNIKLLQVSSSPNVVVGDQDLDKLSYIDQFSVQMYMEHRMHTYQGFIHVNHDYACWYGWNEMTKDLGEIKELEKTMRVPARKE